MVGREEVDKPDDVGIATWVVIEALDQPLCETQREETDDEELWSERWWRRTACKKRWCGRTAHDIWEWGERGYLLLLHIDGVTMKSDGPREVILLRFKMSIACSWR